MRWLLWYQMKPVEMSSPPPPVGREREKCVTHDTDDKRRTEKWIGRLGWLAGCAVCGVGTASERSLFTVARHNFLWRVSAHQHQRKATLLLFLSTHNYFCPPPSLLRERESGKMLLSTSPFCVHQLCWRGGGTFFFCPPFLTPSVDTRATGARDFSLFTLCLINTPSLLRQTPPSLPPENKNKTKQKKNGRKSKL